MIEMGRAVTVALLSGLAAVLFVWILLGPPRRLTPRVRPYVPGAPLTDPTSSAGGVGAGGAVQ